MALFDLRNFDLQLLLQMLLYFTACVLGFIIAVPIGVTTMHFQSSCLLYTSCRWTNKTHIAYTPGSSSSCSFAIYLPVFACILYGAIMGVYHIYAVWKSRADPTIASQMWVMPFLMLNTLICVLIFISSCIVSVGFSQFCSSLVNGAKAISSTLVTSCQDGQKFTWYIQGKEKFKITNYFSFITVAQTASWVAFLIWVTQVCFCSLRYYRNRRNSRAKAEDTNSDTQGIGKTVPVA